MRRIYVLITPGRQRVEETILFSFQSMSFSVVYKIGRSLQTIDIVCFDKQQFDVWTSGLQVWLRSHLVPEHGARVRFLMGTDVNTPFLQVPTLEFLYSGTGTLPEYKVSTLYSGTALGTDSLCAHVFLVVPWHFTHKPLLSVSQLLATLKVCWFQNGVRQSNME